MSDRNLLMAQRLAPDDMRSNALRPDVLPSGAPDPNATAGWTQAYQDWQARGQQMPSMADWLKSAGSEYANALLLGTTAPGVRAPGASLLENPAFAKWFGKSKVVGEGGEPLTVYHGTNKAFETFDATQGRSRTDAPSWATFFTDNPAYASSYAKRAGNGANVMPAHLALENPMEATGRSWFALQSPIEGKIWSNRYGQMVDVRVGDELTIDELAGLARDAGHDGLIARNLPDAARLRDKGRQTTYVAFHPTQIKSAISNAGSYDPMDPRVVYGAAGLGLGTAAAGIEP
jgi:biotin carboxyl carrier protein